MRAFADIYLKRVQFVNCHPRFVDSRAMLLTGIVPILSKNNLGEDGSLRLSVAKRSFNAAAG